MKNSIELYLVCFWFMQLIGCCITILLIWSNNQKKQNENLQNCMQREVKKEIENL